MKKIRSEKSRDTVPLSAVYRPEEQYIKKLKINEKKRKTVWTPFKTIYFGPSFER